MTILGRLKRRPDFLRVAARGRKQAAAGLVLQAYRRPPSDDASPAERAIADAETVRLGFTATKKVGGAVARNRARRRLREAARLVLPQRARAGFDLVLVARQGTLDRPFAALVADLERTLERTGAALEPAADALPPAR